MIIKKQLYYDIYIIILVVGTKVVSTLHQWVTKRLYTKNIRVCKCEYNKAGYISGI
jgi:hypothetical protein